MTKAVVSGALLGGLALFAWGALSWMVLPWHDLTVKQFTDEDAVAKVLADNAPSPGIYMYPGTAHLEGMSPEQRAAAERAAWEKMEMGPRAFVAFDPRGMGSMTGPFLVSLAIQVTGALIATLLVLGRPALTYWGRVRGVVLFALGVGVLGHLPYWNWWGFATGYTLVQIVDLAVGGFLAGLVIARVARG